MVGAIAELAQQHYLIGVYYFFADAWIYWDQETLLHLVEFLAVKEHRAHVYVLLFKF